MKEIKVKKDIIQDAVNIKTGVYAPLAGFLGKIDFQSVLDNMRLASGKIWSIPIVFSVPEEDYKKIQNELEIKLVSENGWAILKNLEFFEFDKNEFAEKVYGTTDKNHPGVEEVMNLKEYLVGGEVVKAEMSNNIFSEYNLTPAETKKIFQDRGWEKVVAFQTRNVPHRGHEFLQQRALAQTDGLFIQPVIGEKKQDDFKDEYIITSYEILIDRYHGKERAVLGILPLKMRYAGPREAIMHALIRKNYGCTHFIVGRDHAGVGDFYPPTAAQKIFDQFPSNELEIEILKFDEVVYDKKNQTHCFRGECLPENAANFSGTKLRESIKQKIQPPEHMIRPEIFDFLSRSHNSLVDNNYKNNMNKKGFVLWFTGLSAAGKSTLADRIFEILNNKNLKVERLDGDIVRQSLTQDLGFSREDREENIRRVGNLAAKLEKNGNIVIASFISPYVRQRQELREKMNNFIEVFVDAPLQVCESRDPKGMYKKARAGEIKDFTGVDDPYESPENPEIHIKSGEESLDESAEKVIKYLENKELI